mgnify:FL=1
MKKLIVHEKTDGRGIIVSTSKDIIAKWAEQNADQPIKITFETISRLGTNYQMRYYRGVVIPYLNDAFRDLGNEWSNDKAHKIMRHRSVVAVEHHQVGEQIVPLIKSTGDFTKQEWIDYIDEVIRFANEELNITIPEPISI